MAVRVIDFSLLQRAQRDELDDISVAHGGFVANGKFVMHPERPAGTAEPNLCRRRMCPRGDARSPTAVRSGRRHGSHVSRSCRIRAKIPGFPDNRAGQSWSDCLFTRRLLCLLSFAEHNLSGWQEAAEVGVIAAGAGGSQLPPDGVAVSCVTGRTLAGQPSSKGDAKHVAPEGLTVNGSDHGMRALDRV